MKVIDLIADYEEIFFSCLEDWSEEIKEAGSHKKVWYGRMKDKGLRVKLALDDRSRVGGMIQYLPIEHSFAEGKNLYFVLCIWVHGHRQGRGNFQKKGMGTALLAAAEEDARSLEAEGMAAWGMSLPVFMRASWFKKHGYRKADASGMQVLLWKPFLANALPPQWIHEKKRPAIESGKVIVTALINRWCPAGNMVFERAKRAAAELGDKVAFRPVDTSGGRDALREWGTTDALFVDGKPIRTGPPPSYDKIKKIIAKRVKKLR
jgi:GNAT superfamily N-acetyltransferase